MAETLEQFSQGALVLSGETAGGIDFDNINGAISLAGYGWDTAVTYFFQGNLFQEGSEEALQAAWEALNPGITYPGFLPANCVQFSLSAYGDANQMLAEQTYDYVFESGNPTQDPALWRNYGVFRATIQYVIDGIPYTVRSVGAPCWYWNNGFRAESSTEEGLLGSMMAVHFIRNFLDVFGDHPDWPSDPTAANVSLFLNDISANITNITIDWLPLTPVLDDFDPMPGNEFIVNVPTTFNDSICIPGIDTSTGFNLALDPTTNCIIATADAEGTDEYVDSLDVDFSSNTLTVTLGRNLGANLVDTTTIDASTPIPVSNGATQVTADATSFDFGLGLTATANSSGNVTVTSDSNPVAVYGDIPGDGGNSIVEVSSQVTRLTFDNDDFLLIPGTGGARGEIEIRSKTSGASNHAIATTTATSGFTPQTDFVDNVQIVLFGPDFTLTRDVDDAATADEARIDIAGNVAKSNSESFTAASFDSSDNFRHQFTHNLNNSFPIVQVYDTSTMPRMILPMEVEINSANQISIYFPSAVSGTVTVLG